MKPFELIPPIKDYIWGGTRLREEFGKKSSLDRLAESWELSCHKDGMSIISGGEYDGMTLDAFLREHPKAFKTDCTIFEEFPILIKLIDARDNLSVQVHPDNEYARKFEGDNGKTEMWYIAECDEGAELIYGFKESITKEEFRKAIEENTLLEKLNRVKVHKGDVFFITPGTLHAIGKGILIAEIQQSSNVTYRVYDYGRIGADGKPRELHIEKALEVTKPEPAMIYKQPDYLTDETPVRKSCPLCFCNYFLTSKCDISGETRFNISDTFMHILVMDGEGDVAGISVKKGSSIFVPAGTGIINIKGECSLIMTTISRRI